MSDAELNTTPNLGDPVNNPEQPDLYHNILAQIVELTTVGYHSSETMGDDVHIYFERLFSPPYEEQPTFRSVAENNFLDPYELRDIIRRVSTHISSRLEKSPSFKRRYEALYTKLVKLSSPETLQ